MAYRSLSFVTALAVASVKNCTGLVRNPMELALSATLYGLVLPIGVHGGRVLAMMVQGHLKVDARAVRRRHDRVPFPRYGRFSTPSGPGEVPLLFQSRFLPSQASIQIRAQLP